MAISCENRYCLNQIDRLTEIKLPLELELIQCYDNLEYQVTFEYKVINSKDYTDVIKVNKLLKYSSDKELSELESKHDAIVNYIESFFSDGKKYDKGEFLYVFQDDNISLVFDESSGRIRGVIDY